MIFLFSPESGLFGGLACFPLFFFVWRGPGCVCLVRLTLRYAWFRFRLASPVQFPAQRSLVGVIGEMAQELDVDVLGKNGIQISLFRDDLNAVFRRKQVPFRVEFDVDMAAVADILQFDKSCHWFTPLLVSVFTVTLSCDGGPYIPWTSAKKSPIITHTGIHNLSTCNGYSLTQRIPIIKSPSAWGWANSPLYLKMKYANQPTAKNTPNSNGNCKSEEKAVSACHTVPGSTCGARAGKEPIPCPSTGRVNICSSTGPHICKR